MPLLILGFTALAQAETTYTDIVIVSDQDIIANITANANDTAIIYVDGIPVESKIEDLQKQIDSINSLAVSTWHLSNDAWLLALRNNQTLMVLRDEVDNNTMKLYVLRGELIGFENEYLNFKNESLILFKTLNDSVNANTVNISKLQHELNEAKERIGFLSGALTASASAFAALLILSFIFLPRRINNRIRG
ncbi:MAG: hypothetical protein J7L20_04810 [Thermoplasmata archaeon]|nr:hypothetical protein [Thermoplasmata archaeon]